MLFIEPPNHYCSASSEAPMVDNIFLGKLCPKKVFLAVFMIRLMRHTSGGFSRYAPIGAGIPRASPVRPAAACFYIQVACSMRKAPFLMFMAAD
jgi:hypothetical protein